MAVELRGAAMTISHCADCGVPDDHQHAVLLVQSVTVAGKVHRFATCGRCQLKRGHQDQHEMREQIERQQGGS